MCDFAYQYHVTILFTLMLKSFGDWRLENIVIAVMTGVWAAISQQQLSFLSTKVTQCKWKTTTWSRDIYSRAI